MNIHQRFKLIRKELKMTQTELGKKIGKKLRTIQDYEYEKATITDGVLLALQEKFNVNPAWLRTGEGEMFLKKEENNIDYGKYQWLINTLNKLPEEDVKQIELEAQKILEKQYNKEMNINHSENIG